MQVQVQVCECECSARRGKLHRVRSVKACMRAARAIRDVPVRDIKNEQESGGERKEEQRYDRSSDETTEQNPQQSADKTA